MHPATMGVESLIDKELSPGHGAIGIQPLFTDQMHLHAKIKGDMRIDIELRCPRGGPKTRKRKSIGPTIVITRPAARLPGGLIGGIRLTSAISNRTSSRSSHTPILQHHLLDIRDHRRVMGGRQRMPTVKVLDLIQLHPTRTRSRYSAIREHQRIPGLEMF